MMRLRTNTHVTSTIEALAGVAPFSGYSPRDLRALTPHVDRLRVRPDTVLAREGQQARAFVIVLDGEVRASRHGEVLTVDGPGAQIGGDAVLRHDPHQVTWTTVSDVEVLVVNGPAYRWAMQELLTDAA